MLEYYTIDVLAWRSLICIKANCKVQESDTVGYCAYRWLTIVDVIEPAFPFLRFPVH
jgi:hypothetical protein